MLNPVEKVKVKKLLLREVERGSYEKVKEFYLPIQQWRSRPIFHERYGKVVIHGLREKARFMSRIVRGE